MFTNLSALCPVSIYALAIWKTREGDDSNCPGLFRGYTQETLGCPTSLKAYWGGLVPGAKSSLLPEMPQLSCPWY